MTTVIRSLNVSRPVTVRYQGSPLKTGIFKRPVSGALKLNQTSLEGDGQADLVNHGGVHKAVYAYPFEHYAYWQEQLGCEKLQCGSFGENLTTQGLLEEELAIGDRLAINNAVLEVSQPRIPCYKLALALKQAPEFVRTFAHSGRLGFYLRVITTGRLHVGAPIEIVRRDPQRISVAEICSLYFTDTDNCERMAAAARLKPLSQNIVKVFEQRLREAGK